MHAIFLLLRKFQAKYSRNYVLNHSTPLESAHSTFAYNIQRHSVAGILPAKPVDGLKQRKLESTKNWNWAQKLRALTKKARSKRAKIKISSERKHQIVFINFYIFRFGSFFYFFLLSPWLYVFNRRLFGCCDGRRILVKWVSLFLLHRNKWEIRGDQYKRWRQFYYEISLSLRWSSSILRARESH